MNDKPPSDHTNTIKVEYDNAKDMAPELRDALSIIAHHMVGLQRNVEYWENHGLGVLVTDHPEVLLIIKAILSDITNGVCLKCGEKHDPAVPHQN